MSKSFKRPWNKGRAVGPRIGISPDQLRRVCQHLMAREQRHDLCLLCVAIDTMLRASDLLSLRVGDLVRNNGSIRKSFVWRQGKTNAPVRATLTPTTRKALIDWLRSQKKQSDDYIFTRHKPSGARSITVGFYRSLIKSWFEAVGIDSSEISSHSLRRTKAIFLYERGVPVEIIGRLLGHRSPASTIHYLGIDDARAQAAALAYDILK